MRPRSSVRGGCHPTPASRLGRSGSSAASAERPILDRRGDARSHAGERSCGPSSLRGPVEAQLVEARLEDRRAPFIPRRDEQHDRVGREPARDEREHLARPPVQPAARLRPRSPDPAEPPSRAVEGRDRDQEWIGRRSGRHPERGLDRPPLRPWQRAELAEDRSQQLVQTRVRQVRLGPDAGCPKDRDLLRPDVLDQGRRRARTCRSLGHPGSATPIPSPGRRSTSALQQRQFPLALDEADVRRRLAVRRPDRECQLGPWGCLGQQPHRPRGLDGLGDHRSRLTIDRSRPPSSGPPSRPFPREMAQELDPADLLPAPRARAGDSPSA